MALTPQTRSVVMGVNGQDGSILAEQLMARGDLVLGMGRQEASRYVEGETFTYAQTDLRVGTAVGAALKDFAPDRIYHVAAVHGAAGFSYEAVWRDVLDVNVGALHSALEYGRLYKNDVRIAYASSAKVFGTPQVGDIGPETPKSSTCLYSITKNMAEKLLHYYQQQHGVFGSVAYLFNHESPRREAEYFAPTLVRTLAEAKRNPGHQHTFRTLDFYIDWGDAEEYMSWLQDLLELEQPKSLIFATGNVWYGRDFVMEWFARHGLSAQDHIVEENASNDAQPFRVDTSETCEVLGRIPEKDAFAICDDMLAALQNTTK